MTEETEVLEPEAVESNPLSNMIDYITQSEFEKANDIFNDVLAQRVSDSLDQEKVAVAQAMYSSEEEIESDEVEIEASDDDIDLEVSDEELEAAVDDLENFDDDEEFAEFDEPEEIEN
jgi:hypothetical protein